MECRAGREIYEEVKGGAGGWGVRKRGQRNVFTLRGYQLVFCKTITFISLDTHVFNL